ncbi:uncharacterized protein LOC117302475 [Asterias rubens]|uniref:uncharacterized protein LOC117302475 n=1 Tax=Asterias rubens TaxID=7604 RepID=UPI0014555407|nr:uncharacterized protein LOC117302475 [Asterias rubens]
MSDMSDIERLRAQNSSLLKALEKGQHNLRESVRSTVASRGSPSNKFPKNVLREKPAELNVRFQRDPLNLSTVSSIRHKNLSGHRKRLTSTPKYSNQSADMMENSTTKPTATETPNRLYQSFLSESSSAFGHSPEKLKEAEKSITASRRRGTSKSASGRRKGSIQKKSPKSRPQTAQLSFTSNQNSRGSRAMSVQLETSSLLPPPLSEKENIMGHGSRYGYRRPLELAHEESYYQLNRESQQVTNEGRIQRSFAGQLLADGNDRQQTRSLVAARPKSILTTPGAKMNKSRNRVSFRGSPNASILFGPDTDIANETLSNRTKPLLGYDWIAGLLDSDSPTNKQSEDFFEEMRQFRQANREECVHKSLTEEPNITASFQMTTAQSDEEVADVDKHTCIHNYTLNPRLFAVPLHGTQYGESLCAVCNDRRKLKQPASTSPSYIRVSIPRSTLASPYRIRPHRRKSYDPTDSVGLSQHCLAGWESSKPSMLPTASNIDLKDSINKMGTNVLNLMSYPAQDQTFQESRSGRASRISKHTQELLNRSHALQLNLQKLERVGMSVARLPPRPNSSSYNVI